MNMMEKLWNEYLSEACAGIQTEAERTQMRRIVESKRAMCEHLSEEQCTTLEAYTDAVCALQDSFVKKAFFCGCKLALSLIFATGDLGG